MVKGLRKMTWLLAIVIERTYVSPMRSLNLDKVGGSRFEQISARKGGEKLPEQFLPSCLRPPNWNGGKERSIQTLVNTASALWPTFLVLFA